MTKHLWEVVFWINRLKFKKKYIVSTYFLLHDNENLVGESEILVTKHHLS